MKIKFFPKKDTVMALLQLQIDEQADKQAKAESELARIKEKKGLILPGQEEGCVRDVEYYGDCLKNLTDKRSLLESHAYPHVTAETEL